MTGDGAVPYRRGRITLGPRPRSRPISRSPSSSTLPIRLGFLSNGDPRDVRTWSGVPHAILQNLEPRVESVVYLPAAPVSEGRRRLERLRKGLARSVGRRDLPNIDRGHLKRRVRPIEQAARVEGVDAVLAITVDQFVAHLDLDVPIVHHSDTTFRGIEDAYPEVTGLWRGASRRGHEICSVALRRAAHSTYPSRWAATQAIEHYGADASQVTVIPYGCNLTDPPSREEALDRACGDGEPCRFLFIGRDWHRKGGPLVLDTMRELRGRGIETCLTVVGTTPPETDLEVTTLGFLNKQVPEDLERYQRIWREAHFLFMPSIAETFGAIYSEAAANGVPALALEVGGVGDAVDHETSGVLFAPTDDPRTCADRITRILDYPEAYHRLVTGARDRFEAVLNWTCWCDRTVEIIESVTTKRRNP